MTAHIKKIHWIVRKLTLSVEIFEIMEETDVKSNKIVCTINDDD